jgi:lipoprotein-anchoring transpeptidase ErfK/SrfK
MRFLEKLLMIVLAVLPVLLVVVFIVMNMDTLVQTEEIPSREVEESSSAQEESSLAPEESSSAQEESVSEEVEPSEATKETEPFQTPIETDEVPVVVLETTAAKEEPVLFPYYVKVNRAQNCITVYTLDVLGEYTVPHKAIICSTGAATPRGIFGTKAIYEIKRLKGGVYGQYATWITGNILFHSVPCRKATKDSLISSYYNKLGTKASAGCIRLTVADAKWLYENCPVGTMVEIYDDQDNPGPLGKPESIRIPSESVWDPTDPDPANPWNLCEPVIDVVQSQFFTGDIISLKECVSAVDSCGNDISGQVQVMGTADNSVPGTYLVRYQVTDLLGRTAERKVPIVVKD